MQGEAEPHLSPVEKPGQLGHKAVCRRRASLRSHLALPPLISSEDMTNMALHFKHTLHHPHSVPRICQQKAGNRPAFQVGA